ncbi:hypothetical protein [Streptomyces griseocarneus]|nr:hypothetical protein [Streptomyces griseocarneus]MBZ6474742.1 hypothetical protein [Streptomyces griseocarneus]
MVGAAPAGGAALLIVPLADAMGRLPGAAAGRTGGQDRARRLAYEPPNG